MPENVHAWLSPGSRRGRSGQPRISVGWVSLTRVPWGGIASVGIVWAGVFGGAASGQAETPLANPLAGYVTPEALPGRLSELAKSSDRATVSQIGTDAQGEPIHLVTLDAGERPSIPDELTVPSLKPALLVLGGVEPEHPLSVELAVQLAERLADGTNDDAQAILTKATVYIVPCAAPTAYARAFDRPLAVAKGNRTPTDDDRDFSIGEDPPTDLNGDGVITAMRIEDPLGAYIPLPADERILIKADPSKGERGRYRLHIEGRDQDGDEAFGEDGSGGVSLNRNGPFDPLDFQPHAGPHPASEAETRAVIDFAFEHPEIIAVVVFSREDTLFHPWKVDAQKSRQRIKTTIAEDDAAALKDIAAALKTAAGRKDAPPEGEGHGGSIVRWAYFHYGRYAVSSRGWWVPPSEKASAKASDSKKADPKTAENETKSEDAKPEDAKPENAKSAEGQPQEAAPDDKPAPEKPTQEKPEAEKPAETKADEKATPEKASSEKSNSEKPATEKPAADKRGEAERKLLAYLEAEGIAGFAPWTAIDHPDVPDRKVEVGGFVPYVGDVPTHEKVADLVGPQVTLLKAFADRLPALEIVSAKAVDLGGGVVRLEAKIVNAGRLPTMASMGQTTRTPMPLWAEWELPEGTTYLRGAQRSRLAVLKPLAGNVETVETLVKLPAASDGEKPTVGLFVWSPHVGIVRQSIDVTTKAAAAPVQEDNAQAEDTP